MPTQSFFTFNGLITSLNFDTQTPVNLLAAKNVVFLRTGAIEPRHGLPEIEIRKSGIDATYLANNSATKDYVSLYYWKTASTETYFTFSKDTSSGTVYTPIEIKFNPSTAKIYPGLVDYSATTVPDHRFVEISVSSDDATTITDPTLSNSPWSFPRYVATSSGLYMSTPRGWYVARSSAFPSTVVRPTGLSIPARTYYSLDSTDSNPSSKWLLTQQAIDVVLVHARDLGNGQIVEGMLSPTMTIENFRPVPQKPIIYFTTDALVQDTTTDYVRIYRTRTYARPPGVVGVTDNNVIAVRNAPTVVPADYYLVDQILVQPATSYTRALVLDDGGLETIAQDLYTNGGDNKLHQNANMPICADAVFFKDFTFFADFIAPSRVQLSLNSLAATTNPTSSALSSTTLTVGDDSNNVTFTYAMPYGGTSAQWLTTAYGGGSAAGYESTGFTDMTSTYVRVESNPPYNLNGTNPFQFPSGKVFFPGVTPTSVVLSSYDAIRIGIYDGDKLPDGMVTSNVYHAGADAHMEFTFDATYSYKRHNFVQAGHGFVYMRKTDGTAAYLFKYVSVTETSSFTLTFYLGTEYPSSISGIGATDDYYVYYVPGESLDTLPIYPSAYAIPTTTTGTTSKYYYSLVPSNAFEHVSDPVHTAETDPTTTPPTRLNTGAVGVIRDVLTTATNTDHGNWAAADATVNPPIPDDRNFLYAKAMMVGATDRSEGQLIVNTVKNLCDHINGNATFISNKTIRAFPNPQDPTSLFIENKKQLGTVKLAVNATNEGNKYTPVLTSTPTNYVDTAKLRKRNQIAASKFKRPESVDRATLEDGIAPASSATNPSSVGASNNRILRLAATDDDLYVFKEREGIHRVLVQNGTPVNPTPAVTSIILFDGTTFLYAPESLQTIEGVIIFLSQKGFYQIAAGKITPISTQIDERVKFYASRVTDTTKIRSFSCRKRKLYGCYFPNVNFDGTGITYVYSLRENRWTTSDIHFDFAATDDFDKLTTITTDYAYTSHSRTITTEKFDAIPFDTNTKQYQYFRQEPFTGYETQIVVDGNLNPVYANDGTQLIALIGTTNSNLFSFADQYDEVFRDFSTVTFGYYDTVVDSTGATVYAADGTVVSVVIDAATVDPSTFLTTYSGGFRALSFTRSAGAHTKPSWSFMDITPRLKNKTLYYKGTFNDGSESVFPLTVTGVSSTSLTTSLPSYVTSVQPNVTTDVLLVGIRAEIEFGPFFGALGPDQLHGFGGYALHFQPPLFGVGYHELPTRFGVAFKTDNAADYSNYTNFNTIVANRTVYDTLVPLEAAKGRWLQPKMRHEVPEEYWILTGQTFIYRPLGSTRYSRK